MHTKNAKFFINLLSLILAGSFRRLSKGLKVWVSTGPLAKLIVFVLCSCLFLAGYCADAQEGQAGFKGLCLLNLVGFSRAETAFSLALMEELIVRSSSNRRDLSQDPNVVLPSAAVFNSIVMAALAAGEDSETKRQLLTTLRIPLDITFGELSETAGAINPQVQLKRDGSENPISRLVNVLFVKEGEVVSTHYQDALRESFDTSVAHLNPKEVQMVNDSVYSRTDRNIKGVLTEINPLMKMILVSASFFKGGWMFPFDERRTWSVDFFVSGSEVSGGKSSSYKVDMMRNMAPHGYADLGTFEAVNIGIKGPYLPWQEGEGLRTRYSALLLLPKTSSTLLDILPSLQQIGALDRIIAKLDQTGIVELIVPKFGFPGEAILPLI
ncbi:MAG: hypothetical protein IPK68_23210 [Bdellovibrionales bacterium]|nr:hypothetical protein [Bdellovibrionales bacterium]